MSVLVRFRRRAPRAAAFAAFALLATTGHAAQAPATGYAVAPVPDWVAPVEPNDAGPDTDAMGGRRHLLVDRQYRDDGRTVGYHHHHVTEVAGQAGLGDASRLSITFDPSYQRLELHSAEVVRDGRRTDRLARARIDVARTENGGGEDLLRGEMTALVVLPNVRVGDRVDVRYTVHGRNPVFGLRHHSSWRARWNVPVARSVLRITVPATMTLRHTPMPDARLTERSVARLRTVQWWWDDLESSDVERRLPHGYPRTDRLEVTAYRDWRQVADWGTELFRDHPADGETYERLSRSIRRVADADGLQPAIAKAIDHVQKRVRYYGLELGENSHRPHSPDEVLANGYGDCKDKALLLASLLGDLGVDAWPTLVSTRTRGGIVDRLPSPGAFDHAIVLVELDGERYWVDATDDSQSGLLGRRGQPEYGAGLVLGRPGDPLIVRAAPVPERPTSAMHDGFYLSSTGGPVDFVTTTVFRGREANAFRRRLDENGARRLHRQYEDYYREVHGKLRSLGPLRIEEDATRNEISVTESYRLDEFWDVDRHGRTAEFDAYAVNLRSRLDELPKARGARTARAAPYAVDGPARVAHRIQFYPNVASPERDLEEVSFGIDGFRYRHSEYVAGDSFVHDSELEIATDELAADGAKAYGTFRDRVMRNARSGRYYRDVDRDDIELGSATATLLGELRGLRR